MLETPLKILALKLHAELDDTVVVRMIPHFLVLTFKILMERKPYKRFWWYLKSRRIYLPKPSVPWISDWETLVLSRVTSDIHISCTQKGCLWLQATILIFVVQFSSVQFLRYVWLFATPLTAACQASLSITNPRVYSNSCPLSQWCHPTISSSVVPFSSSLQSFPESGSFPMSSSSHQVAKVLELQFHYQSFQWIFRIDFL